MRDSSIFGQIAEEQSGTSKQIITQLKDSQGNEVRESGAVSINLNSQGKARRFTKNLPEQFGVMSNHGLVLTETPAEAKSLAENNFDGHTISTQILQWPNGISIQAHPEFSLVIGLAKHQLNLAQKAWEQKPISAQDRAFKLSDTSIARTVMFPEFINFAKEKLENERQ